MNAGCSETWRGAPSPRAGEASQVASATSDVNTTQENTKPGVMRTEMTRPMLIAPLPTVPRALLDATQAQPYIDRQQRWQIHDMTRRRGGAHPERGLPAGGAG